MGDVAKIGGSLSGLEDSPVLQSIFDGITDGILVIDRDYKVVLYNKAMHKFMGSADESIEGRHCFFVCHHNNNPCDDCQAQSAFCNIQPPSRVRTCFRENLKRQFEIWNFPIRNANGEVNFMIEYIKDVTEKQGMEKELMDSRRLAIMGAVVAKTSHEIRNPLNAIAGAAHYLLNEYQDDPKIQKFLGLIKEQIARLNKVVTGLLDEARPKIMFGEKALINAPLLKSLEIMERDALGSDLDIQIYMDERLPEVRYDNERMQQVFINILRNAREAIPEKGSIEVVGHLRQINGEDYLELSFIDSGTGISTADTEKVFESFYTTKKNGTGLGLAVVKEIMKDHGGYAFIESNAGGGTCVRIGLPV